MNALRKFVKNQVAASMQIGGILGLLLTVIIGAYTLPNAFGALANSTLLTDAGVPATSPVIPIITVVGVIVAAVGFLVMIAKSSGMVD